MRMTAFRPELNGGGSTGLSGTQKTELVRQQGIASRLDPTNPECSRTRERHFGAETCLIRWPLQATLWPDGRPLGECRFISTVAT